MSGLSVKTTRMIKRIGDIIIAVTALTILSPVILITAIIVRCKLGKPVLFRQVRAGHLGESFEMFKFRTMREAFDEDGIPLPDAERLTPLGRALRATSLDELPELWNVLRGDMSIVGPRPLHTRYLERYSAEQARRHEVSPGITGWAQVNGRNAVDWETRLAMDVYYVDHWSLGLDARILWLTVKTVLRQEGISEDGQATMTEFMGSQAARECDGTHQD